MNRYQNNVKLVNFIIRAVKQSPELRFSQILHNLNIISDQMDRDFYEESKKTFDRSNESEFLKTLKEDS